MKRIQGICMGFTVVLGFMRCFPLEAAIFSIAAVDVFPQNPIPFGANGTIRVMFWSSASPTFFYQTTDVSRDGNKFLIKIYPQEAEIFRPGDVAVYENVALGALPIGIYQYRVELHPRTKGSAGTHESEGQFQISPKVSISRSGREVTIRWPSAATNYVLQIGTQFSTTATNIWTDLPVKPSLSGTDLIITQSVSGSSAYFRLRAKD